MQSTPRIAILFDRYGHPNQPFLRNWYLRLKEFLPGVQAFTFDFAGSPSIRHEVTLLRGKGRMEMAKSLSVKTLKGDKTLKRWLKQSKEKSSLRKYYTYTTFEPLIEFDPEVVHLLNVQQFTRYESLIDFLQVPFAVSFRGFDTSVRPYADLAYRNLLKSIYEKAAGLQFVSDFLKQEALLLGADPEKCETIYRSIDLSDFTRTSPYPAREKAPVLLSVCRLTWQKGLEYAFQAIRQLKDEGVDVTYRIVGDGAEKNKLIYLTRLFDIEDRIVFAGHMTHEEIKTEMERADIMLQTSVSEAMPNTLIEASAMQLPVVATTAGGMPEIVTPNQNGLLVEPADPAALAHAVKSLLNEPGLREQMGEQGRRKVEETFQPERECKRYADFYMGIAERGSRQV